MASDFSSLYLCNLEVFVSEMKYKRRLIELLKEHMEVLKADALNRLNRVMNETLTADVEYMQNQIINSLLHQIESCKNDLKSLTVDCCDILENYVASLEDKFHVTEALSALQAGGQPDDVFRELRASFNNGEPNEMFDKISLISSWIKTEKAKNAEAAAMCDNEMLVELADANGKPLTKQEVKKDQNGNISGPATLGSQQQSEPSIGERVIIALNKGSKTASTSIKLSRSSRDLSSNSESEEGDYDLICHCQQQAVGEMVACDNKRCKIRWFHWGCVGIYFVPSQWLCPFCQIFGDIKISRELC